MKIIVKKAFDKLTDLAIPYNLKYKPKEIYSNDHKECVYYHEIYPTWLSTLNIPEELYNSCTNYLMPKLQAKFPPAVIVDVPSGRLINTKSSVVIISKDNRIVHEASYQFIAINEVAGTGDYEISKVRHFKEPQKIKGTLFNMQAGGGAAYNYGHWLIDAIPRLHLLKKSGLFDEVDWFLVPSYKYDYHHDTLKLLGVPEHKIIVGKEKMHLQADRIIGSSTPRHLGHVPQWIIDFLRDSFSRTPSEAKYPPLVYISRRDSSIRNIVNERELVDMLNSFGFVEYELSQLPFIEKVNLFRSAEMIVSAMGAGLANLVFCRKGAILLELFSKGFISTMFTQIAIETKMNYNFMVFPSRAKSMKEAENEHFSVDVEKIKMTINKLLYGPDRM
jgi:capsular polysaccharide biosynthesis protein